MKRVEIERQAITHALKEQPNITEAAHALGASRRTLQSRMRDYGMPPGQAGRPRRLLPQLSAQHRHLIGLVLPAAVIAVVGLAGLSVYLRRRTKKKTEPATLSGLDLFSLRG